MEDQVALVASEQKKFQKSVKGIKKLIKSGKIKPRTDKDAKKSRFSRGVQKKPKKEKGLVYISHIPHGFYENEMSQYFKQFGVVSNVRVLRSSRTGRSKGAAFVEFLEPAVAQIVADTMNNYLMGKRLLKAVLIPPEKQKAVALRKNWNSFQNPSSEYRRKMKKVYNENGTDQDDLKLARKQLKNVLQTKKKLKDLDIDYDFFTPVDVPEELLPLLSGGVELPRSAGESLTAKKQKKNSQDAQLQSKAATKIAKKSQKAQSEQAETKDFIKIGSKKAKNVPEPKQEVDSDDSDDAFDSDEFEMTLESDDDLDSGDDDDETGDSDEDAGDSSEEDVPPVIQPKKKKLPSKALLVPDKKKGLKTGELQPVAESKSNGKKRKPEQTVIVSAKKTKNESSTKSHVKSNGKSAPLKPPQTKQSGNRNTASKQETSKHKNKKNIRK